MGNYTQSDPVLSRFFDNLPEYPRCTDSLKAGCKKAPKHVAIKRRYIEVNKENYSLTYIPNDCDYEGAGIKWHDNSWYHRSIPTPTFTVSTPENLHAHINYELTTPVHTGTYASRKAIGYLYAVRYGLTQALEADHSYGGLLTKNPLSEYWIVEVYDVTYDLDELAEYLRESDKKLKDVPFDEWEQRFKEECRIPTPGQKKRQRAPVYDPDDSMFVFWNATSYATSITADYADDKEKLGAMVYAYVIQLGVEFNLQRPESRNRSDAKSVTKFHWKHRDEFVAKRQAFCEIQRQRAYRSHKARKRNNKIKIQQARHELKKAGKVITKTSLAEETGLSRRALDRRVLKTDPADAKRIGAYNSHDVRKAATEEKIKQAFEQALRDGIKPTQKNITDLSGVSLRTVKTYWKAFNELG